jgi:penicillin-binding protein 2
MSMFDDGYRGGSTPSRNRPHSNLLTLRLAVIILFALLTAKLFDMQIINGGSYAKRSVENHIVSTNILPSRGLILARDGTPLVQNVGVYSATITPQFLPTSSAARYQIYLRLESILNVPALQIQSMVDDAEANQQGFLELPIKKYLARDEAIMLDEASTDMPGVALSVTPGRLYLGGPAFSSILGYVGAQSPEEYAKLQQSGYRINEPIGKTGLESTYESDLRGSVGVNQVEQDAQGDLIQQLQSRDATPGDSIKLSIDPGLQNYVSDLLSNSLGAASHAAAVVMSAKTGEIYSMVSIPEYDNNIFGAPERNAAQLEALANDPRYPFLNQAITDSAPGSVFKLITASAGLQEGTITPQTTMTIPNAVLNVKDENGQNYPLVDWEAHGTINLYGGIAESSNIYFFMVSCGILGQSKGLGKDVNSSAVTLGYYARAFGLGAPTGIDLDGEAGGIIPSPDWKRQHYSGPPYTLTDQDWYYGDTCNMGIGQGFDTATPLQIARMTAAVANGGKLLTPHLVTEVDSPDGKVVRTTKVESKTVPVSPANLAVIRQGMHDSVNTPRGAGILAAVKGLDIAGKTGTAEFGVQKKDGSYDQHAWFTGFWPYNDPQFVVTVYFDLGVGGSLAAPTAARIFDYISKNVKP